MRRLLRWPGPRVVLVVQLVLCLGAVAMLLLVPLDSPWHDFGYLLLTLSLLASVFQTQRTAREREVFARIDGRLSLLSAMCEAQERGMSFGDFIRAEMERDTAWAKVRGVELHGNVRVVEDDE